MSAGSIVVDLLLKTGSFSTDAQRSAKDLEKLKKQAHETGVALGNSLKDLAAAAGVTLTFAGIGALVKGAIDAADHLNDLSKKTGIAVDTLGGMGFAAGLAGGDLNSVAAAAGKLNKSLAEAAAGNKDAAEAFQVLGIAVKDAGGATRKTDEVLADIADRFAEYEDGPEKAALALKIFGKAGADIIPLLDDGGKALRENIEYYQRFAGVTAEVAAQADQFNDTLAKSSLIAGAFGRQLASDLLPALQAVADEFGWLHAYSPYHHVVDGTRYPAVMLTTGMTDPRVDPWHAAKMTARLQAATASGLSESEVQAGLSAAIQPGSLNMLLTVKAPTPEQADAAVDSLYKTTLKANEGDTNIKAVAVSAPSASSTPAGVPKKILYAAVVLLAAMVAVVVALIVDQFRSEGRG